MEYCAESSSCGEDDSSGDDEEEEDEDEENPSSVKAEDDDSGSDCGTLVAEAVSATSGMIFFSVVLEMVLPRVPQI